jgi:NAD(P)-dependent dehydrogenase (short-subunit alcohol dehydrogenase family)
MDEITQTTLPTYLVVGASSGIGAELASGLRGAAQVWTASRSPANGDPRHLQWDATAGELDPAALPERLDGLVYCPGSIRLLPFERLDDAAFLDDIQVNLLGAVRLIRAALPALRRAPQASAVLFSSVAATCGMPMHASVAAAKGAVEGLTRALAAEFAPRIRVNAIAPSLSDTPLAARLLRTERQREGAAARHPLERIGTAADQAAAARFLLSPESAWVTGQVIAVDGGLGALRRFS